MFNFKKSAFNWGKQSKEGGEKGEMPRPVKSGQVKSPVSHAVLSL